MQTDIPKVRVVYYNKYYYQQEGKPMSGYAIEIQSSGMSDGVWDLVLFCENKNGNISSAFVETMFYISELGYVITIGK